MALLTQFELFIYSILIGVYLGVTYDLLYYFIFMHVKKYIKYAFDIIFFISQAFIIFNVIYEVNKGIIPFYSYFLIAVGFLLYYRYQESYYENEIVPLKNVLRKLLKLLKKLGKKIFINPFLDTYDFVYTILNPIIKKIKGCVTRVQKKFKAKKKQKATT